MRIFFAWYDFWIGWYWDRHVGVLYVCPIPMLVFQFGRPGRFRVGKMRPHFLTPNSSTLIINGLFAIEMQKVIQAIDYARNAGLWKDKP